MRYTLLAFWPNISYIIHDLGALGFAQKIQVIDSLQVDALFIVAFMGLSNPFKVVVYNFLIRGMASVDSHFSRACLLITTQQVLFDSL